MSSAPNQLPRSSKSASSSHSQTEAQADSALEPSSPAETMTDQTANSVLMTPPTRMTSSGSTESEETSPTTKPPAPEPPASTAASNAESSIAKPPQSPADPPPDNLPAAKVAPRNQPIPPASEPMQYRAIGLVRGRYMPSEEQFTRGLILTEDGVQIDAVLLGRVMSLVKKHIDLAEPHLWVVYPRTRDKELDLHMQIVGVWEPDKLNRSANDDDAEDLETDEEEADETEEADDVEESPTDVEASIEASSTAAASEAPMAEPLATPEDLDDRYFSVRGEVVFQSEEEERLLIKIRRAPKQGSTQAKAFKVALKGTLSGKGVGYFWDFQVQRENNDLVVKEATQIGMVPPQKRQGGAGGPRRGPGGPRRGPGGPGGRGPGGPRRGPGGPGGPSGPPRKRWQDQEGGPAQGGRPYRDRGERSGDDRSSQPPSTPRQPISKPIKRRPPSPENS